MLEEIKEGNKIRHELSEVGLLKELPEMQDIITYLENANPEDEVEAEAFEQKRMELEGWANGAFIYDNEHHTNLQEKLNITFEKIQGFHDKVAKFF